MNGFNTNPVQTPATGAGQKPSPGKGWKMFTTASKLTVGVVSNALFGLSIESLFARDNCGKEKAIDASRSIQSIENSYRSLQSNDALKVLRSESSFDSIGESGWMNGSQRHNSVHAAKNKHRASKIKHIPSAESYFSQPFQLLLMIGKKDSLLSNMFDAVTSEKLILGAIDSPQVKDCGYICPGAAKCLLSLLILSTKEKSEDAWILFSNKISTFH
ncbi:hypothetical protein YC2023_049115 [Brassica napus]